jgi:hypothetical protein
MNHQSLAIQQFARTLRSLDACLRKAEAFAESRGFDVGNFVGQRLFPDMLPFVAQVRIATDMAKATAANLSGLPAPKHADDESSFPELHARIESVLGYLQGIPPEALEKTPGDALVNIPFPKGKALRADEYLFARQLPNFFFHVSMAYGLLRAGGVPLGKLDFIGTELSLFDA